MRRCWPGFVAAFSALSSSAHPQSPAQPPTAPQLEHISIWHGEKVNDPFFWLREKSNPAVIKYLEAENAYTEAMTKGLQSFAEALYQEMLGHIKQTDHRRPGSPRRLLLLLAHRRRQSNTRSAAARRPRREGRSAARALRKFFWTPTSSPRASSSFRWGHSR